MSADSIIDTVNKVVLNKRIGETPLECILRYKNETGEKRVMTYAGRLDPMAEGALLCLIGDECKNKDQYLALNKKYTFEILVGFSTDTHDLLGIVSDTNPTNGGSDLDTLLLQILPSFIGKQRQTYPAYSSKTVNGVQLHTLARANKVSDSELPSREVEIFELNLIGKRSIRGDALLKHIINKIDLVKGDFRQDLIKARWKKVLNNRNSKEFQIIEIEMSCSSGTYVRALIRDISQKVGIPMCAHAIKRTKIGDFELPK